jgi:hypothetical protein
MSAFWRNTSASPPAADLPGGVAEGPFLTQLGSQLVRQIEFDYYHIILQF